MSLHLLYNTKGRLKFFFYPVFLLLLSQICCIIESGYSRNEKGFTHSFKTGQLKRKKNGLRVLCFCCLPFSLKGEPQDDIKTMDHHVSAHYFVSNHLLLVGEPWIIANLNIPVVAGFYESDIGRYRFDIVPFLAWASTVLSWPIVHGRLSALSTHTTQ